MAARMREVPGDRFRTDCGDERVDVVKVDVAVAVEVAVEGLQAETMVDSPSDSDKAAVGRRNDALAEGTVAPRNNRAVDL